MSVTARVAAVHAGDAVEVLELVDRIGSEVDWSAPLPERSRGAAWRIQAVAKRLLDIVVAGVALVLLLPLFVVVAGLIKATSKGPVLYEWRVLGRHAKPFVGYKFRTMVVNADELKAQYAQSNEMTGPVFKLRDDPRVTRVGRWFRKYSIDELPQLWSVLIGDMSLVGPRPVGPDEFIGFEPWQRGKLAVIPGITCLWQVGGRSEIRDFATWAALDLEYIRRWNLILDLRILARTIPAVISARGAY
ncbi:MAG TPA: sugar transferase [Longimicrobiales bacterium]|nr:sugar transferase [Longimicrobiales bacterium]